ncbi:MAG: GNAT family N-acetyltransferase [Candidatus Eisenbacteria bacterium]
MSVRYLSLERAGRLCGGMPAILQRRAGFHWIHAMPALLSGAPLALPGEHREVDRAAARGLDALAGEVAAVGGAWSCYRAEGESIADASLAEVGGETRRFEAAHVPLAGGLEPLLQRMDRKTRKEMRQARERGLSVDGDDGALIEAYSLYRAQAKGWSSHRAIPLELLRRLLRAPGAPGTGVARVARLFAVRDARGLLAATLALDSAHETMLWWSGSHPGARAAHAFPLLLWAVVEWAHAQGRVRVNLGASAGLDPLLAFKGSLGAVPFTYPVRWLDARHAHGAGRAVAWLQARVRRGRPRGEPV